jgi:AcrR family transcriptional regulator
MTNSPPIPPPFAPFEPTERQREILDRAFELVQESGLAQLTLKRVADRVGFTEAAIYRHFANKRELVLALVDLMGTRLLAGMRGIVSRPDLSPTERIERMVRFHVEMMLATRGVPFTFIAEGVAGGDRELVDRFGRIIGTYRALLVDQIAQLGGPTTVPDDLRSVLFLGLPAALGILSRTASSFEPGASEIDALVRFYVRALTSPVSPDQEMQP